MPAKIFLKGLAPCLKLLLKINTLIGFNNNVKNVFITFSPVSVARSGIRAHAGSFSSHNYKTFYSVIYAKVLRDSTRAVVKQ